MSSTIVEKSLYEQLGGSDRIEAVVNHFYERILNDKELRPIFDGVDMEHLRMHQARFVSFALGGPNQYTGRSMRAAHEGLEITEEQFFTVAGHLIDTLASFNVPAEVTDQVLGHIAKLKGDIVERS
jgi:hemoglobin